jgi:hypothetical protein
MKILIATALLLSAPAIAAAADPAPRKESVNAGLTRPGPPPLERLVKPLGLSADQQKRLKPLFAEAVSQAEADVKAVQPGELAAAQKVREADFRLKLANVLSPEQLTGYERLMAEAAPKETSSEMFSGHGHRDADNAATAADVDPASARPLTPPAR